MGACGSRSGQVTTSKLAASQALSTLGPNSKPSSAVVPPGQCVFTEEWSPATLVAKEMTGKSSRVFTFALPDATKPLGLSTCACILAKGGLDASGSAVVRPYTPISTNSMIGKFELLIKIYPEGLMSQHIDRLSIGDTMDFKHIPFNVKVQYPYKKKAVGMICGGTGVTPMIQALHALLGTPEDKTHVSMLYGSRVNDDILAEELLNRWADASGGRFTCTHVLSQDPEVASAWRGCKGRISRELIQEHMPPPSEDCSIFVCGPPGFYDTLCGPRNEPNELTGLLKEMGYTAAQVVKF